MKEISKGQLLPPEVWNSNENQYPTSEKCIHHLVEEQASKSANKVAVEFEGQSLTYAALEARANAVAGRLSSLCVGPEVIVAIYMRRSLEMIVGLLGILKAGGAYVPLDPDYPKERLEFMLKDSGASVLMTQMDLVADLTKHSAIVVCLDDIPDEEKTFKFRAEAKAVRSENLAYVIYTSGSTGRPKGVQICHRSGVNLLLSVVAKLELTTQDTMLAVTTLSADVSVAEIFLPLITGGRLVIVGREASADGFRLLRTLEDSKATILSPTPATWRLLLAAGWTSTPRLRIISTGEALPRLLANQLLSKGVGLWNFYGPTETTVWSTCYRVISEDGPVFIGKPLPNTTTYILDSDLEPLPLGATGELYIGGDGLARGYLNQPDLTARRFIRNPFSRMPESRLYKTGDLARYAADGNIECLGRIDHQVKIRGHRIELAEVEAVLTEHTAISEAVVIAQKTESGDIDLLACMVLKSGAEINEVEVRNHLKTKLPRYMVPSMYVTLDRLPLTPNGKVDRKALPKPKKLGRLASNRHVAPRDHFERLLVEIWQQVLALDGLGVNDSFIELGGDSLRGMELILRVEGAFGVRLPVESVYRAPSVAEFRTLLDPQTTTNAPSGIVSVQDEGQGTTLFCLHSMPWHLTQMLKPDFKVYGLHSPIEEGVRQWLQTGRLELTVEELAVRYLRLIKTTQPQGPYYLTGFSFGGLIAFETARRLRQEQQEVALLCILDTFYVGALKTRFLPWLWKWTYHSRMVMRRGGLGHLVGRLKERCQRATDLRRLVKDIEKHGTNEHSSQAGKIVQKQLKYMGAAASLYRTNPYPGNILLFRAMEETPLFSHMADRTNGWGCVVKGEIDVVDIKCNHRGLLVEPYVQVVAKKLRTVLRTVHSANITTETAAAKPRVGIE